MPWRIRAWGGETVKQLQRLTGPSLNSIVRLSFAVECAAGRSDRRRSRRSARGPRGPGSAPAGEPPRALSREAALAGSMAMHEPDAGDPEDRLSPCGHRRQPDWRFCNICGIRLPRRCSRCRVTNGVEANFCSNCGMDLRDLGSAADASPGAGTAAEPDLDELDEKKSEFSHFMRLREERRPRRTRVWRTAGAVVVIGMLGASLLLYTILSRPRLTTSTSPSSTAAAPDVDGSRQSVGTPPELPRGEGHPSALPTQPEHGQGAPSSPAQSLPSAKESPAVPRVRDYEPIPELRDVHFRSGRSGGAVVRPGDVTILDANAAWLRANPGHRRPGRAGIGQRRPGGVEGGARRRTRAARG